MTLSDMVLPLPHLRPHLLVVDDDARLRQLLQEYLVREGFLVSVANHAAHARQELELWRFAAVVVDGMMPGEHGADFTRWLTTHYPQLPVLMLTAQVAAEQRIAGLEAGAKDYLAKPFEPRELLLRLRNLVRLSPDADPPQKFIFGVYQWLPQTEELMHATDGVVLLSDQERLLLSALIKAHSAPVSRETLAKILNVADRHVDVAINRLRKKIEKHSDQPRLILTVRGAGYRLPLGGTLYEF